MNGLLQHWSSCREWGRETGRPQTLEDCAELVELLWGLSSELCLWLEEKDRVQKLSARKRGNVSSFRGEWHFFRGLERERERKISVNLTKRLRTASILRDCAHVTGCVFWDGCFILCLLQCCISCSWSTSALVKQQQLGLRTKKKKSCWDASFFSLLWKDLHKHTRILSVARCWHAILFLVRCWILGIGNSFGRIPVWIRPMSSLFMRILNFTFCSFSVSYFCILSGGSVVFHSIAALPLFS